MLRPTQVPARRCVSLARTGLSPAPARLSRRFRFADASARRRPYNPGTRVATPPVWAPPRSLAATGGIVFTFYSCGYLDVSVPRVRLHAPHGCRDRSRRVAPFGNPRIRGYLLLPAAYRSLSRPSSPPRAKASPMRPSSIPFYLHGRQGKPGVLFVFALPSLPFGLSSPPEGASVQPHGARCVLLYEFMSSRSWSARSARASLAFHCFQPCHCALSIAACGAHASTALYPVENNGVEPLTLCLQSRCSSQLS